MTANEPDLAVVIMAGGTGTRFWPVSTSSRPKQFLNLLGDRSLLQMSFDRIAELVPVERLLVLTGAAFVGLAREQLPQLPPANVIGEPVRRDTAAASCLGAVLCRHRFGNPVVITLTADHLIEPVQEFQRTLLSAARGARRSGALYTIAIEPTFPSTGYGYLERGRLVDDDDGVEHYELLSFQEKPDAETAGRYLAAGHYSWNSGMFVWTADSILAQMTVHLPGHVEALQRAATCDRTDDWPDALAEAFAELDPVSVDYGVMERAEAVRCVAAGFTWSDVGGWLALGDHLPRDDAGNRRRGRTVTSDASGNLVFCEDEGETVMLVGVDDLVVVRSGTSTLVVPRHRTEEIKMLVEKLED